MSRPTNRECQLPELGDIDRQAGEFWVANPFQMPSAGHNLSAFERNRLYMNVGGEAFLDASFASQVDLDSDSRSAVVGDFNRDGAVDLLVGSVGGGALRLFYNRAAQKAHYVRIELAGTRSNASAIGSRVILHIGTRRIVRDLFAPNGFMGQSPPELVIGVGDAQRIDKLQIRWPTGEVQEFADLPVDTTLSIKEGDDQIGIGKPSAPRRP